MQGKTDMLTNPVLWIRDMIQVVHPGSRFFTYPGVKKAPDPGSATLDEPSLNAASQFLVNEPYKQWSLLVLSLA
jgi:hypothetical protein